MPIQATVILDSGCFLTMPPPEENIPRATEIGYFLSSDSIPDIKVRADGHDVKAPELADLGGNSRIEVRHVGADGKVKRDGVKGAKGFQKKLLHLKDLYGKRPPAIDRGTFDCIIRFECGLFCPALVKPRSFKEHKKQESGEYQSANNARTKDLKKLIMHNVFIHFMLENGEELQIIRNRKVIWSSKGSRAKTRLDLEFVADNTTTEKFYGMALKEEPESYWMPNWGDPPPVCSQPPCEP